MGRYRLLRHLQVREVDGFSELLLVQEEGTSGPEVQWRFDSRLTREPAFARAFQQVAAGVAGLRSAHLAAVLESGREGESLVFTLEYLPGVSLRELADEAWQSRKRLSYPEIIGIGIQVAAGLEGAHAALHTLPVAHGGLRPEFIWLTREGGVQLLGLGYWPLSLAARSLSNRRVGRVMLYRAPEQFPPARLTNQSDLFALGAILHELVTGVPAFRQRIVLEVDPAAEGAPSPVYKFREDCPPQLARIISHCLEREPSERYASASELREELESLQQTLRASAPSIQYSVSFEPSFEEKLEITVSFGQEGGLLTLRLGEGQGAVPIPPERGRLFLAHMEELAPAVLVSAFNVYVRDGTSFVCRLQKREEGLKHSFYVSNPDPQEHPHQCRFIYLVYQLAVECAREPRSQQRLESLRSDMGGIIDKAHDSLRLIRQG